jgi:DNA-binding CsgD family transcriptional regulator
MHIPGLSTPALVGRDRECDLLWQHLNAATAGQGRLVFISGEAGIGKTALAEALCREAVQQHAHVLVGRCFDLTECPAYGPWAYLFSHYHPDAGFPEPPPIFSARGVTSTVASRDALFRHAWDFLVALTATGPVVLLLDDLQWADTASLDLLRFLAQSMAILPLLILITYRSDELTASHALNLLLPTLVREASAARIDLRPLDIAAVRLLVAARYALPESERDRLVAYIQARAEGNPFYLGELLRSLEETGVLSRQMQGWRLGDTRRARIPPLLRQVIDARLARFGVESQRLLTIAAVIGHDISLAVWTVVGRRDEQILLRVAERALAARLFIETVDGDGVQFAHALVREALYERIPAIYRRRIHMHVGEALAATRTPDPDAVAYHFQQAGDDRAGGWLIAAGERAQATYAWHMAADRFDAALALLEAQGADAGERGWLLLRLALLCRYTAYPRALQYVERARQAATEAADPLLAAYARFTEGLVRCFSTEFSAEFQRGVTAMEEGVAALAALFPVDGETQHQLERMGLSTDPDHHRGTLADWLAILGMYEPARALGEAVAGRYPAIGAAGSLDCGNAADAFRALGYVYTALGQPQDVPEAYRRAEEAYRAIGDHFAVLAKMRSELRDFVLPYRTDDLAERRRLAAEISDFHAKMGSATFLYPPGPDLSPLLLLEGRWDDDLAAALRIAAQVGWPKMWAAWMLGALARERGDSDDAWAHVAVVFPDGPTMGPQWRRYLECIPVIRLAALLCLDAGNLAAAKEWLEMHDRWLAWNGAVLGRSEGRALWTAYYRATGDTRRAREHAELALRHASNPRQPLALLAAHRLVGELATQAGQNAQAVAHLDQALALADACAAPYERALTLIALAELHATTTDMTAARACCTEARGICLQLHAKPAITRIDALAVRLEDANARPRYPAGLTGREVEVLRLIAAGHTNRQIADMLSLTEKTVKHHVTHILTKIDASNRAAAATFAHRHGLA